MFRSAAEPAFDRAATTTASRLPVLLIAAALASGPALATTPEVGAADPDAAEAGAPLDLGSVVLWRSIRGASLSDDGGWFAYRLVPGEGDSEVVLVETAEDGRELRFDAGEAPARGRFGAPADVELSADGRWAAFRVYPTRAENQKSREKGPGERPKAGLALVDLESGERTDFEDVEAWSFSGERSTHLAVKKRAERSGGGRRSRGGEDADDEPKRPPGSDLLLRELATSRTSTLGHVSEMAFDEEGRWLALAYEAPDRTGNALELRDLETGTVRVLDSGEATFRGLSFTEAGDALAVLRGSEDERYEDEVHVVLGFRRLEERGPDRLEIDPAEIEGFPEGLVISADRSPAWRQDLSGVVFGITEPELAEDADEAEASAEGSEESSDVGADATEGGDEGDEPPPKDARRPGSKKEPDPETADLVVWHWKDDRLQSMQQVQEGRDERFTYLAHYDLESGRVARLADEDVREVRLDEDDRWALGTDRSPYELAGNLEGRRYADLWRIDPKSGERARVLEKARWTYGADPTGERAVYYRDGHFHAVDLAAGTSRNLTAGLPTSFVDDEDDHNVEDPPDRFLGYASDGSAILLQDGWDVWRVALDGSGGVRVTSDGEERRVRYGPVFDLDDEDDGIDLDRPVYLRVYEEWTKRGGIARLDPGSDRAEVLVSGEASFGGLLKAEDANVYAYTREDTVTFPDYLLADADLEASRRLTDANPQQAEYSWSPGSRLLDYECTGGERMQAALFLPAGYREGERYPTIVYIYERLSQSKNRYDAPTAYSFDRPTYTSNGYAVLMPDITYRINDPGMSAVACVLPALDAAIESGVVDPDRVGLHGHSWGGYQTAFLVTQTDRFAAAVAGAPLTNMISMYSSIYWNTGSANQPIFESSQGRFAGDYLDHLEAYARNSPVYHANQVETPLLLLHNDEDGAVDWNQGIEYFNTLRRLGKPVVMLQYRGENHGLREPANRQDYYVRMKEFFDHHLRGAEAPGWWTEGVDHLDRDEYLEQRAKELEDQKRLARERAEESGGDPGGESGEKAEGETSG